MGKLGKILIEFEGYDLVAGVDEVGRGCGAGPVYTAAVILPKGFESEYLRDSKYLTEKQREKAQEIIIENALSISCTYIKTSTINEKGIDYSIFKSMHNSILGLDIKPEHILVDGNTWKHIEGYENLTNQITLVAKGDDTYSCIAAASIMAKFFRDETMTILDKHFPEYKWGKNKGYLTADHIAAIKEHGANKFHRTQYIQNFVGK